MDSALELTDEQRAAVKACVDFLSNEKHAGTHFTLGGYAGTGKTTVLKEIVREYAMSGEKDADRRTAVAAYTGKAASVLRRKGVRASTIHSLIYHPIEERDPETGATSMRFDRREPPLVDPSVWPDPPTCTAIVIDEASMVSRAIHSDLASFNVPMLYVGDPGQLEPIGDSFNPVSRHDLTLQTIHRQAAESAIIRFAHFVRQGGVPRAGIEKDDLRTVPRSRAQDYLGEVDQVLCGFNRTRHEMNGRERIRRGLKGVVEVGDRLICVRNYHKRALYNGLMAEVTNVFEVDQEREFVEVALTTDLGHKHRLRICLPVLTGDLQASHYDEMVRNRGALPSGHYFEYGFCVTTHKAQGSEWDRVLVIEEAWDKWDMRRWRYTAVTRAAKELVYAV